MKSFSQLASINYIINKGHSKKTVFGIVRNNLNDYFRFCQAIPKNRFVRYLFISVLLFSFNYGSVSIKAQDLLLDTNFISRVNQGTDQVKAIVGQPDGKILIGGDFRQANEINRNRLARFNGNGTLDENFNPSFPFDTRITGIAVQPDGKIIVSGRFSLSINNRNINGIVRINPDGNFDTNFTDNLTGYYTADELAIQPDGKIVGAGYAFYNSNPHPIFRLMPNGSVDNSFQQSLQYVNNIRSVTVMPDGKLLVGGVLVSQTGVNYGGLVRLNQNGSVDTSFNSGGTGAGYGEILKSVILPDGKILAAGYIQSYNGMPRRGIVRLNANGTLDETFNANNIYCSNIQSFVVQPSGKILITDSTASNTTGSKLIVRLNENGSFDSGFISGFSTNSATRVNELFQQPNGQIIAGGIFTAYNGISKLNLLRLGRATNKTRFDFDGDGKADIGVFRPSNGTWFMQNSSSGFFATAFGVSTDRLVPADYDGDGKTDIAVYRNGTWYMLRSGSGFYGIAFGATEDIPQPADYDGDGKAEIAVYRPSNGTWYFYNLATNAFSAIRFGATEDKPVSGDYDGDGKADVAVFRPSEGNWYIQQSTLGFAAYHFGISTDKPISADYDGDGKTDVAVFRNGNWYIQQSANGFYGTQFGFGSDIPVAADYDGDGKVDIAVFRNGYWYLQQSSQGFTGYIFGLVSDRPLNETH